MTEVLVYVHRDRADVARSALAAACRATDVGARLDIYGSGSLYQRLGPRHAQPMPDVIWWFGPFAARAAALDGLLQAHRPVQVADGVAHDPDWKWTALEYAVPAIVGATAVSSWQDVSGVARLAIADPERSEVGLSLLLASLDRARQAEGDVERGWAWWQQRARDGLLLAEDDAGALALVESGRATHALTLSSTGAPLQGLAPVPHAIGIAASSKNVDAAQRMVSWLTSDAASEQLPGSLWHREQLAPLLAAAPSLDFDWAHQQYTAARVRWSQSGFGPTPQA